jgi:2,3-bisphosphoglycerate-dependent phosphoglycerate mutase
MKYYKNLKEVKLTPKENRFCYIYLFRHGQSTFNKEHKFTGWMDAKLTSKGIQQAKQVGNQLKSRVIDVAIHSHLSRSKDTLKQVIKHHKECTVDITDDRIIERSYGKLSGHHHSELVKQKGTEDYKHLLHWHKVDHLIGIERDEFVKQAGELELKLIRRSYETRPPGGESIKDVEKRVNSFLKDLIKFIKKYKVNVAISAHGNSMRPFRRYFEKFSKEKMITLENPFDKAFIYKIKV